MTSIKAKWAALGFIGLLALGSTACAYDDYGDHRGGRHGARGDHGNRGDRNEHRGRDDRRDRDRPGDHGGPGGRDRPGHH